MSPLMGEKTRNRLTVGLMVIMAMALVFLVASYESPDDRVERIGAAIKCPVCQGESIANSPSSMATDMMDLVAARVDEGRTDDEIIGELLTSFSGAVLLDPPASGSTLFLWLAPLAALLVGLGVILWWQRHPGFEDVDAASRPPTASSRNRKLVGGLILIGGFAVTVVLAGIFLQDRAGTASGVANPSVENLDDVSNETMEAVIASNQDNPQINGMRLALAERYFSSGDYRKAFPHYLSVAESELATGADATTALIRLGWMAYDGNGEVDAATRLLDQALAITPDSAVALYLKGQVLWCGAGDPDQAADLLERVLETPDLNDDTRVQVEGDLDLIASGGACT